MMHFKILIMNFMILTISPLALMAQTPQPMRESQIWFKSNWVFAVFILLILFLLYRIRLYERSRQKSKLSKEKNRELEDVHFKAELGLKETRKEYHEVLDNLRDCYLEADKDGIISYANLAFSRELGFDKREELMGKPVWDFIQKEFAGGIAKKLETLYQTKQPLEHFKTRYVGRDGHGFVGEAAFSPFMDKGELIGFKGTIRNVTRKHEVEKELAIQKDFLDALLEQTPVAVVNVSKDNKISFVNPAFQELFGYGQEEVIGKYLDELLSAPENRNQVKEYSANPLGERLYLSGKRKKKDHTMADVEVIAQPFFAGSINYGHLIFYIDISERLRAEARLAATTSAHRAVLETLSDSYFEADHAGFLTYVNQPFLEATKYRHKDDVIGKHFRHLVARSSRIKFLTEFKNLYASNKPIRPFDMKYVTRFGEEFSSEIVASPIYKDGKTVGTRGIIRDISMRVKAEAILKTAKEAAEKRAGELASINRVAEKVSSSLNLQDILQTVCQELMLLFPILKAGIALLNEQGTQLEVMAFHSIVPEEKTRLGKILFLEGEACMEVKHLILAKESVLIRDAQNDPLIKPLHNLFGKTVAGSFTVIPLVARGKTIGILGMTLKEAGKESIKHRMELAETVASQIATAVDNAQLHLKTEKALDLAERDLEIGREIQSGFFPSSLPEIPDWELSAYFKAARQVSGDFYDVFSVGNTSYTGIVVADVCDKGVGAALFMVLLRSLIRSYSEQLQDESRVPDLLHNMAVKVNHYIVHTHGQSNMFATLFLGILDPGAFTLYYVNGGHDSPLLIDGQGRQKMELLPTGPAFGFSDELNFEIGEIGFAPGDVLFAFTDGLTEAKNPAGDFYTDEHLQEQARRQWPSAFSAAKHLELEISMHMGEQLQFDDITLLVLRRKPEDEPVSHRLVQNALLPNLPLFRGFVAEACQLMKVDSHISENLQLAVDEVCSNLIRHGYKGKDKGDIVLSVRRMKKGIEVQIEDSGRPFDPASLDAPDLSEDLDERTNGGLGVYLVRELVDEISYESKDGLNCLSLSMKYNHQTI